MKYLNSLILLFVILFSSCNVGEPSLPYTYNANPRYTWGYQEYFGREYAAYGINTNIFSISLFSDSLGIDQNTGSLIGIGQYLFLEDIFVPSTETVLPVGTYTINSTRLPNSVSPGRYDTVGAEIFSIGATISYYEENTSNSKLKFITAGTFTVAKSGSNYTINCNFITDDKKELKGSFTGKLMWSDESLQLQRNSTHKIRHLYSGF